MLAFAAARHSSENLDDVIPKCSGDEERKFELIDLSEYSCCGCYFQIMSAMYVTRPDLHLIIAPCFLYWQAFAPRR